jgi:hypothetical protein
VRLAVLLLLIVSLRGAAAAQASFDGTWRGVITCAPHAEDGGALGARLDSRKCDFTFAKD